MRAVLLNLTTDERVLSGSRSLNLDADNGGKFNLYASYYLSVFSKGIIISICVFISSACLCVRPAIMVSSLLYDVASFALFLRAPVKKRVQGYHSGLYFLVL